MRPGGPPTFPLPWREVNGLSGFAVAETLAASGCGLTPSGTEKLKWACPNPGCGSSDAFHTFRQPGRRSCCYSCGIRLTHVDLAALLRGEDPRDALRWLAGQFQIPVPPWSGRQHPVAGASPSAPWRQPSRPKPRPRSTAAAPQNDAMAALLALPDPVLPEVLYADLLERLRLGARGTRYVEGRGIPAAFARDMGFRSVEGPSQWGALRKHLKESYPQETLRAAGFPLQENGRVWTPFGGVLPMLVIPFLHAGKAIFLRMRTIGPPPQRLLESFPDWSARHNRYRGPKDVVPPLPFHADALSRSVVHVVEGEINGATLCLPEYGQHAVGLPGAWIWDARWALLLGDAFRVVLWYDSDSAGRDARALARQSLAAAHGDLWLRARVRDMYLPEGTDLNALHVAGQLLPIIRTAPWMGTAA